MGRSLTSILGDLLEAFISAIYQDQYLYAEHKIAQSRNTSEVLQSLGRLRNVVGKTAVRDLNEVISWIKKQIEKNALLSPSGYAFGKTEIFVVKLIEKYIDFDELVMNETNYKDILLKYFQKRYKDAPVYKEIAVEGPPHKRLFRISVHHVIGDEFLGSGEGKTKKDAQQIAAKNALEKMGIEAKYV